jgi:cytochrome P450
MTRAPIDELTDDEVLALDPLNNEYRDDPYPLYRRFRELAPVYRAPWGGLVLFRAHDCEEMLHNPDVTCRAGFPVPGGPPLPAIGDFGGSVLLFIDPPQHTRLRRLISRAFTPKRVATLREKVGVYVDEILDRFADEREMDVVDDLGYPLPLHVICEMLGVPTDERAEFKTWSAAITRLLDGDKLGPRETQEGITAALRLSAYFSQLFHDRRKHPQDDLLSDLLAAEESGDRLTLKELRATVALLFIAGHETVTNLVSHGTLALTQFPDQFARIGEDPSLVPTAVEELLRWDSPTHLTFRRATHLIKVDDQKLEPGEVVVVLTSAANRDPARFPEPERLDVGRVQNRHLSFGHGIHHCVGAALSRMEGQEVFRRLATRFPTLSLVTERVERRPHFILRGFEELRVAW